MPKFSPDEQRPPSSASRQRRRLQHDESFDVPEDGASVTTPEKDSRAQIPHPPSRRVKAQSTENIRSPSPFALRGAEAEESRPYSGPEMPSGKFKYVVLIIQEFLGTSNICFIRSKLPY